MTICFVGSPLSGKSTLARKLAVDLNVDYFSTGDYARSLGMDPHEKSISEADLSVLLNGKIEEAVISRITDGGGHVIDGFPRSEEQVAILNSTTVKYVVIYLYADPTVVVERAFKRSRDGDDVDTVVARLNAAIRSKFEIEKRSKLFLVYTITGDLDADYQSIKEAVRRFYDVANIAG